MLDSQHPSSLPFIAGQVCFFAMNAAPSGFLACNGGAVLRSTYSKLFALIGTTYGAGDGSLTFNLPDLRGEFIRALDNGRAVDSGRSIGSAQADDFRSHQHGLSSKTAATGAGVDVGGGAASGGWGLTSLTGGTETRPRNVALLACIFTGVQ